MKFREFIRRDTMVTLYDFIEVSAQIGSMHHKNKFINGIYNKIKERKYQQINDKIYNYISFELGPSDKAIRDFIVIAGIQFGCDADGDIIHIKDASIFLTNFFHTAKITLPANDDEYESYIIEINENEPFTYSGVISGNCVNTNPKLDIWRIRIGVGALIRVGMDRICRSLIFGGEDYVHGDE